MRHAAILYLAPIPRAEDHSVETQIFSNDEGWLIAGVHPGEVAVRYLGSMIQRIDGTELEKLFVYMPKELDEMVEVLDAAGNSHKTTHLGFFLRRLEIGYPQLARRCKTVSVEMGSADSHAQAKAKMKEFLKTWAKDDGVLYVDATAEGDGKDLVKAAAEGMELGGIAHVDMKKWTLKKLNSLDEI